MQNPLSLPNCLRVMQSHRLHRPPAKLRSLSLPHPALSSSAVAVVTGGGSGIGLAAAKAFARLGLRLCIADLGEERLAACRVRRVRGSDRRGGARHDRGDRRQPGRRGDAAGSRGSGTLRRHRRSDEQRRSAAGQRHVRPAGELGAGARCQSLGRYQRHQVSAPG